MPRVEPTARGICERASYGLLASEPHHSFGHDLVGQVYELDLRRQD